MTTHPDPIREALRAHLRDPKGHAPDDEDDLFAHGYLTSLKALQLVRFLEDRFAIELQDEDLKRDNFHNLRALRALVAARLGEEPPA